MKTLSTVYVVGLVATVCAVLTLTSASPAAHNKSRTIRGFKTAQLSTARGFGKRGGQVDAMETVWDPNRDFFAAIRNERPESDSFPTDWFIEELAGNPELARLVVNRFIDRNQDGELTPDELLRPF